MSVHAGASEIFAYLEDYIFKMSLPVECTEPESKYFGQCCIEKISSISVLNDEIITKERQLQKSDLKTGDRVIIRYHSKDFRGVVDLSQDEEILNERGSPSTSEKDEPGVDPNVTSCSQSPQRKKRRPSKCPCGSSDKKKKPRAPGT